MEKQLTKAVVPDKRAAKSKNCSLLSELLYVVWIVALMVIFRIISGL